MSRLLPTARRLILAAALAAASRLGADPLSKRTDVDFYRDVLSRDLHGLATRSDGRLVWGPVLTDLKGQAPAELLWCLEPAAGHSWLVGAGPGGRILSVTFDLAAGTFASKEVANIPDVQMYALKALPDGSILAGTSPQGGLYLVRGGQVVARTGLPADSLFDLLLVDGGKAALVATGNPGRIYRIDLAKFARAGVSAARTTDGAALAARGVTLFGEAGDRNLRRLVQLADGRIAAGSAPKGNLYLYPAAGGAPYIADENRDAEVTDIVPDPGGGFYASIVYSGGEIHPVATSIQLGNSGETSLPGVGGPPTPNPNPSPSPVPGNLATKPREATVDILNAVTPAERFPGRSTLKWFGPDGFPEVLTTRSGVAFYRMVKVGDLLVISGGELGEMTGFEIPTRLSLTFAGSASVQVNALAPLPGAPGKLLALRNNAPGFSVLDFGGTAPRSAETKRIDLGAPARLGAFRFDRVRDADPSQLTLAVRMTNSQSEAEGWSPWVALADRDGWRADVPTGRYAQFKLSVASTAKPTLQLDRASLYFLTQNHRPQLQDFRMLTPGFAIIVPPEQPPSAVTTVGQLISATDHEGGERRRNGFLGSTVVASPGTRVCFWTVTDADNDNLVYTFSIRHDGDAPWTDLAVDSPEAYVQFDTLHLAEGIYFTRLVAKEAAPRPEADRLTVTFETDDMLVDHTPPVILEAAARRTGTQVQVSVHGRDALSLLDSAEFTFNNGEHQIVEQPADGILDGREETFVLEVPAAQVSGATSVEVTLYDAAGNGATQRLSL